MTGAELVRRLRRLARKRGVAFRFDARHGKGDHGMLHYDARRAILGDQGELPKGTLHAILKQLGLGSEDLRE